MHQLKDERPNAPLAATMLAALQAVEHAYGEGTCPKGCQECDALRAVSAAIDQAKREPDASPPLVKGGQGRSDQDVYDTGVGMTWLGLASVLAMLIFLIGRTLGAW